MMRGYWRDPELTATVIDADGWLHTGDLGTLDADGIVRIVGRLKEMYIRGGYNVYPTEVEAVLAEHPAVAQVAVVGLPDPVLGEVGGAFVVVAEPTQPPQLAELRDWSRARIADYKAPDRLIIVDELPVTPMHKVDKTALRDHLRDHGGNVSDATAEKPKPNIQDVGTGDTRDKPIKLGGALVTMVEPHKGHEVAYNRWYERDHFYAGCQIGAWNLAGTRFVATRECKAKRYPENSPICPDPTSGSYLAVYWILAGKFGEWIQWGTNQVNWLHENDRMFPHRDHIHTLMYKYRGEVHADEDGVPAELALDRRYPGLVLVIGELAEGVKDTQVTEWVQSRPLPADQVVTFTPIPLLGNAPSDVPRDEAKDRFCHLYFVDGDPVEIWDEQFASLGDDLAATGLGTVVFASPFIGTVAGTDTYTDQLW